MIRLPSGTAFRFRSHGAPLGTAKHRPMSLNRVEWQHVIFCVQGVISPLLANLFLHYAFDRWMAEKHPQVLFERYADDAIVHCRKEAQAQMIRTAIAVRLKECGLELHPE